MIKTPIFHATHKGERVAITTITRDRYGRRKWYGSTVDGHKPRNGWMVTLGDI